MHALGSCLITRGEVCFLGVEAAAALWLMEDMCDHHVGRAVDVIIMSDALPAGATSSLNAAERAERTLKSLWMCATFFAQYYNIPLLVIGSATGDALLPNAATLYTQVPSRVPSTFCTQNSSVRSVSQKLYQTVQVEAEAEK